MQSYLNKRKKLLTCTYKCLTNHGGLPIDLNLLSFNTKIKKGGSCENPQ